MQWFHLFTEIKQQRNNLFLWSPMAFAFGIAATFAHGHWISPALLIFLLICVLGYLSYYGVKDSAILPLFIFLFVATLGAGAASLRSYAVWAPALSYPYYGEVQGVIRTIDRSGSGSLRVTLLVSAMDPTSERHRPQYVRISSPKYTGDIPEIEHSIKTTAYVTPPQGPVEPDGFDFRRHAYFQRDLNISMPRVNSGFGRIGKGAYQFSLQSICQTVHWALHRRLFRGIA